jgi:single-strand DNA-binding protein
MVIGYVAEDPEIKSFQNGDQVASFRVGTSESWTDKQTGEKKDLTDWHSISVFNPHLVKVVGDFVKKGSRVYVEGKSKTRKWQDKDGNNRYSTEIVLSKFDGQILLLTTKESGGGQGQKSQQAPNQQYGSQTSHQNAYGYAPQQQQANPFSSSGGGFAPHGLDDEVPF